MVSESNEWGILDKSAVQKSIPKSNTGENATVWIYMQNEWHSKDATIAFAIMDGLMTP